MKSLKNIAAVLAVLVMTVCLATVNAQASSYKDVDDNAYYADAVESLTVYGVISGYDGRFNPDDYVTRAEFAKIISIVAGFEDTVHSSAGSRKFTDVPLGYWGTGYINTAATNKLIVGYPNGLFMPEKNVTFAEAVTVILRAMDYSTAELGDNWPYAYMVKAKGIGITDGITLADNSPITRADLCVVVDKALQTELNRSSLKLISKLDINITDEMLVVATKNEDASLDANRIRTDSGVYKLANNSLSFVPLTKVKLILNDKSEVINFMTTYVPEKTVTTVESYVDGTVYFEDGTNSKLLGVTDSTPVYNEGTITGFGAFKNNIETGAMVSVIYDENNAVGYLLFKKTDYTDAVVVKTDIYSAFETVGVSRDEVDGARVIRDGYAVTLEDIEIHDVAYYLADNRTIYLYSDKITGIYKEAFPSKANVTSAEISGNILEIETKTATYKLGENADSYKLNSKVTVLLGRTGKIVDVVEVDTMDTSNYGILLSASSEMSEDILESGKQYYYLSMLNGEGKVINYRTKKDYSKKIGHIGKISFDEDGDAMFVILDPNASVKGQVDKVNKKIGEHWLTSECVILERIYAPDTATGTARAQVIEIEDITVETLTDKNVLYAVTVGEFEDVSLLIVENVTDSRYVYGILKSMSKTGGGGLSGFGGSYEVFANGSTTTMRSAEYTKIDSGVAVGMIMDGNSLVSIKSLIKLGTLTKLEAIDFSRVKASGKVYAMGDDVQIVRETSRNEYTGISLNEASEYIGNTVRLYADTNLANGGKVRIIIIN